VAYPKEMVMNYQDLPHWKELEIKPFSLADVPPVLQEYIYPEELARKEVLCPKSIYMIVLALRWTLSDTDSGFYDEFETWKVYWKSAGKYGFENTIYLAKEKFEGYDYDDEYRELQPQVWIKLATLHCSNGKGIIDRVTLNGSQPYGGSWTVNGAMGVRRLLEDAILGSQATNGHIERNGEWTSAQRIHGFSQILSFRLTGDYTQVEEVELKGIDETW